jgi:cytidylate kinase
LFEPDFLEYRWDGQAVRIIFRWIDITSNLKEPRIDQAASIVSTNSFVREKVNRRLRWLYREQGSCVVDGRDGGTKIFPDANLKIFLTASLEIRAERWRLDQEKRGNIFSLVEACDVLQERDSRDSQRAIAPLSIPEHAVVIDNGMLTEADTVEQIVALVYSCPSTLLR